jgi:hypothetical protein
VSASFFFPGLVRNFPEFEFSGIENDVRWTVQACSSRLQSLFSLANRITTGLKVFLLGGLSPSHASNDQPENDCY